MTPRTEVMLLGHDKWHKSPSNKDMTCYAVTMCRVDNSGFVACHVVGTTRTKGLNIKSIGES